MTDACLSRQHDCQFNLAIRPTRVHLSSLQRRHRELTPIFATSHTVMPLFSSTAAGPDVRREIDARHEWHADCGQRRAEAPIGRRANWATAVTHARSVPGVSNVEWMGSSGVARIRPRAG